MLRLRPHLLAAAGVTVLAGATALTAPNAIAVSSPNNAATNNSARTPINHVVVIFQENVSFDHYFGTYPSAANTDGQTFKAKSTTPKVNNLVHATGVPGKGTLLTNNPNSDASGNQVNPQRLAANNLHDVLTCDQGHNYNAEQKAFDGGKMDKFVTSAGQGNGNDPLGRPCNAKQVMDYYDGNTVTGLWNYAQHFAMSDNSFGTTFGPSAPGAVNLVSGDTGNVGLQINGAATNGDTVPDGQGSASLIEDPQPYYDDCSTRDAVSLTGQNVGDLLNQSGLSWGWFQGGFKPTTTFAQGAAAIGAPAITATFTPDEFKGKFSTPPASDQGLCNAYHPVGEAVGGTGVGSGTNTSNYGNKDDYIAHHEPFQYYASTANPHHLAPASLSAIGTDTQTVASGVPQFDTANHQYDTSDFNSLVEAITHGYLSPDHLPAVSFIKAPGYQDGHPAYSDPIDEQKFVANEINLLEQSPDWGSTAVIVNYDDSDGWYDHVYSGVHNASNTASVATPPGPQDFLTGTGLCGDTAANPPLAGQNGRCGYGPRLPLLVISPWARKNFVDHTLTDQTSILKFIEDNWGLGRIPGSFDAIAGPLTAMFDFQSKKAKNTALYLDPTTGQIVK